MDIAAILGIVTGGIGLINQLIPVVGGIAGSSAVAPILTNSLDLLGKIVPMIGVKDSAGIGKVVDTLKDMAPLITDQIGATYKGVKNIINSLGAHPATTDEQMAALEAFDKEVDAAWDAIEGQLDPDANKS